MVWKTSPRIDEQLCRRVLKLKRSGVQVRGLGAFMKVLNSCWKAQAQEDGLPRSTRTYSRFLREARQETLRRFRGTVELLSKAGHDPAEVFESLGFAPPNALAKLDDVRLSREVRRLCAALKKRPNLRGCVALNLPYWTERMAAYLEYLAINEAAMQAAPARARARVKKWDAALRKFRLTAEREGVRL